METGAESRPVVQLLSTLEAEGIRYMLVGMSAANLQGILVSTVDVDVWIGLPSRQYMRVMNLCRRLNATVRGTNKVYLSDDTPVDFIYEVSGLPTFDQEYRRALRLPFHSLKITVLPLERIRKSKQAIGRDKDALHILLINQALKLKRSIAPKRKATKRGVAATKRKKPKRQRNSR
jgi:hypothetical protein